MKMDLLKIFMRMQNDMKSDKMKVGSKYLLEKNGFNKKNIDLNIPIVKQSEFT